MSHKGHGSFSNYYFIEQSLGKKQNGPFNFFIYSHPPGEWNHTPLKAVHACLAWFAQGHPRRLAPTAPGLQILALPTSPWDCLLLQQLIRSPEYSITKASEVVRDHPAGSPYRTLLEKRGAGPRSKLWNNGHSMKHTKQVLHLSAPSTLGYFRHQCRQFIIQAIIETSYHYPCLPISLEQQMTIFELSIMLLISYTAVILICRLKNSIQGLAQWFIG